MALVGHGWMNRALDGATGALKRRKVSTAAGACAVFEVFGGACSADGGVVRPAARQCMFRGVVGAQDCRKS